MITGSAEYQQFLADIAIQGNGSYNPPNTLVRLPVDEKVYQIDWNSRTIEAPEFIGVEADHEAEYIYFEMDRYVDQIDLSTCVGLIVFKNAAAEEFYQIIPSYDILSKSRKIIFAWDVQSPATKYAGVIRFSFKFFKVDSATKELLYELNTLVAKTKVLQAWSSMDGFEHDYSTVTADKVILHDSNIAITIQQLAELGREFAIYWYDVD